MIDTPTPTHAHTHTHTCTSHSSLLTAVEAHYKDPTNPYPGEDNATLYELTPYLESAGLSDPLTKVCHSMDPRTLPFFPSTCNIEKLGMCPGDRARDHISDK